ncbi:MAG: DUF1223 domain-containing protein, partial [Burkholderiales bacterium]|nr:DUF1223 domain-containing protein [Burkholderiales bacterium]
MRRTVFALTTALQVFANADTGCPTKSASSGPRQTALIELYTSEGCSSCPPVDRWLSGLPAAGFGPQQVVALAFHVDYWDYLGWRDGFASATNTARQHRRA